MTSSLTSLPLYQPSDDKKLADRIFKTAIDGLLYLDHDVHTDNRGFYSELSLIPDLEKVINHPFIIKQINQSHSAANVVRGFHAEGWNKLVTVITGKALSVLADTRPDSPTFLNKEYFLLDQSESALDGCLFIASNIANSICVLEGPVDYLYCVDTLYRDRDTSGDSAISLFDPDLDIAWPIDKNQMIISDRDRATTTLRKLYPEKF
ncbi:hypothetical protein A3A66_00430 [Microgenomates group bacterium RIFCSPLOWO2_01_FULL_46_13]|nr:MAG: hypothetical protein A2783_03950 [Microgenomates group bacterium RIFCSPHIGHO2_01_FULL_45_11]OGV94481.1 MAG: hypothetical protein A3A66_00430 [Microgenomates group bacterium RIFCSPLOWO2_01_FULL_46_13]